jgi:gas vesicle structural protein
MTLHDPTLAEQLTLLELVDRVVNKGVVLSGDITLSVAGVDLIYVGLRVLLSSVDTLDRIERERLHELLAGVEP